MVRQVRHLRVSKKGKLFTAGKRKIIPILKRNKAEEDANVLLWFEGKSSKPTKDEPYGRASEYTASVITNYPNNARRGYEDVRVIISSPHMFRHKETHMVGADQNNVRKNPQKWASTVQRIFLRAGLNVKVMA
jgi:hypothetical protein